MYSIRNLSHYFLFLSFAFTSVASPIAFAAGDTAEDIEAAATDDPERTFVFDEMVITAPSITSPLILETDPKKPRQPVPAADGGGYLKNIPGFSLTRKGGTGGDPLFRGMGGTRLNVLMDGASVLGGCPSRMDPTTTYAYPESYSKITLIKGPQSVLYGSNIAGTILFERDTEPFSTPGTRMSSSLLFGSAGRRDQFFDVTSGDKNSYVRVIKTKSDSDDYKDGNGQKIHSAYSRESLTGIIGFTPNSNTLLEFSVDDSNGQAAYADRMMDGSKFDRTSYNVKFEKKHLSSSLENIKFNASRTFIDHVMDNYSLRPRSNMSMPMSMEVKRTTTNGRLAADFNLSPNSKATVGVDYQKNVHSGDMIKNNMIMSPMSKDMTFENYGFFTEYTHDLNVSDRLLSGIRFDNLSVTYAKYPGREDKDKTHGAFLRYEHDYANHAMTSYIGIGHAQRPADWWERKKTGGMNAVPEKNTQLDTGLLYHSDKTTASVSLFYSNVDDFILLTNRGNTVKNIDAYLYGGEATYSHKLSETLTGTATLAYTRGTNKSNNRPLPQIAPLEGSLGLKYAKDKWETGILWRMVAAQKRYTAGDGNEIGTDIGPSGGFGILSLNTAYRVNENWTVTAGVDNLLDKNYAEFVSRTGAAIAELGIPSTTRVNEPGRTFWLKANCKF